MIIYVTVCIVLQVSQTAVRVYIYVQNFLHAYNTGFTRYDISKFLLQYH